MGQPFKGVVKAYLSASFDREGDTMPAEGTLAQEAVMAFARD